MSSAGEQLLVLIRKHMKLRSWTILPTDVKLMVSDVKAEAAGVIGTALAIRQTLNLETKPILHDNTNKSVECHSRSSQAVSCISYVLCE